MKKILLVLFVFLLSCTKEEEVVLYDPNSILNTQNWKVTTYVNNGVSSNVFNSYTFSFSINETPGCPDWMDGKCIGGVFGGHYFIFLEQGINKFKIILPNTWNLNEINGTWEIYIINSNTIHLKRISNDKNQRIVFQR